MEFYEIMNLYQTTHEGFSEEEIVKAEQRIGTRLPDFYRNYLKQYGHDKINQAFHGLNSPDEIFTTYQIIQEDLEEEWQEEFESAIENGTQNDYKNNEYFSLWQLPIEQWSDITDNYVLLWTENQGIWNAGYLLKDLQSGNTNPPVYISTEDDFITFQKCADTMEQFLKIMFQQAQGDMTIEEFIEELHWY